MGFVLLAVVGTYFSIGNQWLSVGITDALCWARPGSVVYLTDKHSGQQIAGTGQFSGINTGSFIPANGTVEMLSDTSLVFHSEYLTDGTEALPISLTVEYTIVRRGLEIEYRFEYLQDCEVFEPLDIDYCLSGWDSISTANQSAEDEQFTLDGTHGFQRFSGDQLFMLSGGLPEALFLLPNVSKGIIVVLDNPSSAYMSIRVLDTEEPRENATGPDLHSIIPAGQVDEYLVRFSMDDYFAPLLLSGFPDGAEHSAAWMLDELPFVHPPRGYVFSYSETSEGDEKVSAGLISLLYDHPLMKMNWLILPDAILTPNRDSVWFEPGFEDSWSHWHATWRISTLAPPEYIQWLLNIQNNVYPWAEQVQMGSHGYHHTPNPDSSYGGFHEFITYEPLEHQERFRINSLDIAECGLDSNMVRVIRYSGHRTSLSGLQATIDHGFALYCNGWRLIDYFAGKQFRNQWITRYQTTGGRIWGTNSVWWADYFPNYPRAYLSEVMEKGKFCLLGGHPSQMLATYTHPDTALSAYARIDSLLTSLENDYDNFLWLFPAEYGDFLENCFNIRVNSIRGAAPVLSLELTGFIPEGLTFCAFLHPDDQITSVTLDGTSIPWELRDGGRLFAVSPQRPWGEHSFSVNIDPMGIESGSTEQGFGLAAVSPSPGSALSISLSGLGVGSTTEIAVYDISGRVVHSSVLVPFSPDLVIEPVESLVPGVYLITATSDGFTGRTRTVVIP